MTVAEVVQRFLEMDVRVAVLMLVGLNLAWFAGKALVGLCFAALLDRMNRRERGRG